MKTTGIIATFAFAALFAVAVPGCRNGAGSGDENAPTTQPSTGSGSATADADEAAESTDGSTTETTADTSAEQQSSAAGTPVNQYCAVEQQHPADAKITYTHDGKTFAFCCEDCIDTFKKAPAQYTDAR